MKKILFIITCLYSIMMHNIGYAADELNIKYIDNRIWRDDLNSKSGVLAAVVGENSFPFLTISTITNSASKETKRQIIVDPYAIHKNKGGNKELIMNEDYFLSIPSNVVISYTVEKNIKYLNFLVTHTLKNNIIVRAVPKPLEGGNIEGNIKITNTGMSKLPFITDTKNIIFTDNFFDGKYELSYDTKDAKEGDKINFKIKLNEFKLYGSYLWSGRYNSRIDDFTIYDFEYRDKLGTISLGTIREWITNRYDNITASSWSKFKAKDTIRFNNNIVLPDDNDMHFKLGVTNYNYKQNTLFISVNNKEPLIDFVRKADAISDEYDIIDSYITNNIIHVYVDTTCNNPKLVKPSSYEDEHGEWIEIPNQTSSYPVIEKRNNKDSYHLFAPINNLGNNFLITVKGIVNPSDYNNGVLCYEDFWCEKNVIIKSPNGTRFNISVDDDGNLKAVKIDNKKILPQLKK